MDQFEISRDEAAPGVTVIAVTGEVDMATAPQFTSAAQEALAEGSTSIVVDLRATTFLDSSGLGAILAAVDRARLAGGNLAVVNVDATIQRTLEITGMNDIFPVRDSLEAALEAIRA